MITLTWGTIIPCIDKDGTVFIRNLRSPFIWFPHSSESILCFRVDDVIHIRFILIKDSKLSKWAITRHNRPVTDSATKDYCEALDIMLEIFTGQREVTYVFSDKPVITEEL